MSRLATYYDKLARNYSLNWAIALSLVFAFYTCIGIFQFLKYFHDHDTFYMFAGPFNTLIGAAGTFNGIQVIHAVVRRLVAEPLHHEPDHLTTRPPVN